ncbi:MAG: helix-turn-helix transcriptional regulator [Eubacteriales bacterium]|nr:helix-turn-helix transcriptional regulator [Eubacteriales bacterium]
MNRIKELRIEKHITQVRLSIDLEVSQEAISAYEVGKHYPSAKSLIKLREIFNVSIDYILGLSDQRCPVVRADDLKPEEADIVQAYRRLDDAGRERLLSYMQGYLDARQENKKQ